MKPWREAPFVVLGMQLISSFISVKNSCIVHSLRGNFFFPYKGFLTRSPNKNYISSIPEFLYNAGENTSLWCLNTSRGSDSFLRGASSSSVGARRGQHSLVRNEPIALMFRHLEEKRQCPIVRLFSSVGIKCE